TRTQTETPPRTWGRQGQPPRRPPRYGNTPTDVGKTESRFSMLLASRKHPHGRGEDASGAAALPGTWETPPRTWGRRSPLRGTSRASGNTPTDVGKTWCGYNAARVLGKHPHGRGEDAQERISGQPAAETPPRTWGRQRQLSDLSGRIRNTPTDVGKTPRQWCNRR